MEHHTMPEQDRQTLKNALDFIVNAPEDPEIIAMDCNEGCEQLASLAERVARGEDLQSLLPELEKHMQFWGDCREEFDALVAVLKAELCGALPDLPLCGEDESPS